MKKLSTTRKIIIITGIVLVIVLGTLAGLYFYYDSLFSKGAAGNLPDNIQTVIPDNPNASKESQLNLLICAIDYDPDGEGEAYADPIGKTDVILYVNLRTDEKGEVFANVLQIPRDTYIGMDKSSSGRMNLLYRESKNTENRVEPLANEIYNSFKLPIDNYLMIDMPAFKDIINAMGGIEMYVPWDVYTPLNELVASQGLQKLDGDSALLVVRQRQMYAQKDYKRLEMQQYFYKAVFQTLRNDIPLTDLPIMAKIVAHYSQTDMKLNDILPLCGKLLNLKDENIFIVRAPGGSITKHSEKTKQNESLYAINKENIAPILNEHFRIEGAEIPASELGLLTDFEYKLGETNDPGHYLGDLETQE